MDASHNFGSGLSLSASGDLLMVDGSAYGQQRLLRRLLTNPGSYIWHGDYGGGLPGFVGRPANAPRTTAVVLRQMKLESVVSQQPAPSVTTTVNTNGTVTTNIAYVDATTGATVPVTPTP